MSNQPLGPDDALNLCVQKLNAGQQLNAHPQPVTGLNALPAPTTPGQAPATPVPERPPTLFTVEYSPSAQTWLLNCFVSGVQSGSMVLTAPPSPGLGFYQIQIIDGEQYMWNGSNDSNFLHCETLYAEHQQRQQQQQQQQQQTLLTVVGVAAKSAAVPGLSS